MKDLEGIDLRGAEIAGDAPENEWGIDMRGGEVREAREPGFGTAVRRGYQQFKMGRSAMNMQNLSQEVPELDRIIAETQDEVEREEAKLRRQAIMTKIEQETANIRSRAADVKHTLPMTEGYKEYQQTEGPVEPLKKILEHPGQIAKDVIGESFGAQAPTAPLTVGAGIATGGLGFAASVFTASTANEAGNNILEDLMQQKGVDINDPEQVAAYMSSPEGKAARSKAIKQGATVGAWDAATAGFAGAKLAKKPLTNIMAQTGVQAAGGAAGEVSSAFVGDEEVSWAAVYAEALGEGPTAVVDVGTLAARRAIANSKPLNHAAKELETEAATGGTTEQGRALDDMLKTATATMPEGEPVNTEGTPPASREVTDVPRRPAEPALTDDVPPVEDITGEVTTNLDEGLEDLDAMFNAVQIDELTPDDITAALEEETAEAAATNPQAAAEAQLLNDSAEVVERDTKDVAATAPAPTLPPDLAGANPRYGFGKDLFEVEFEDDIQKAAYIAAGTTSKSKRDTDYVDFVRRATGYGEEEVRSMGRELRARVKELAREMRSSPERKISLKSAARPESHTNEFERMTRLKYTNPNDEFAGKIHKAPILAANDESAEGLTLEQRAIAPGEVIALGVDSDHTPEDYMRGMREMLQGVVERYAPSARVALSFLTEAADRVSSYQPMKQLGRKNKASKGSGLYRINLRNATHLGQTQDGTRNITTQLKIVSSTMHEVGHVIAEEQMTKNMSPELRNKFETLGVDEYFTPEELATLPADQAAVLQEYNELKWRTLNDPEFSGEQWADQWLSPWKLAHGVGSHSKVTINTGLRGFVKYYLGESGIAALPMQAKTLAMAVHNERGSDILSPHEYMAEQMSRYAYTNAIPENSSPLAMSFFRNALDMMRSFFRRMKGDGAVKPGVAFSDWMDSLSSVGKVYSNPAIPKEEPVAPAPKEPKPKKAAKPRIKVKIAKVNERSSIPPSPVSEEKLKPLALPEYTTEQMENFRLLRTELGHMRDKTKGGDPALYDSWMQLVRKNRNEDFRDSVQQHLGEEAAGKIRYDTDVQGDPQWREIDLGLDKVMPRESKGIGAMIRHGLYKGKNLQFKLLNLTQAAWKFPEVAGLQTLMLLQTNYKAFKNKLEFPGLDAVHNWSKLGKEQHGLLEQAMRREHYEGKHLARIENVNGTPRFVATEELAMFARDMGLETDTVNVWLQTKNAHLRHMNALQNVLASKIKTRLANKPATAKVKLAELEQQFKAIRHRPFLPQTRFGTFGVRVQEKIDDQWHTAHIEFFETEAGQKEARELLKKVAGPNRRIQPVNLSLTSSVVRTLPPEILGTWADEMELTEAERKELKDIANVLTMNPRLRSYSDQLSMITGANRDLRRNFADFMVHNSSNIAKMHYREHMKKAVGQIRLDAAAAAESEEMERHNQLVEIAKFANSYVDQMMQPSDEWQMVRAVVVYKQLWGNIKTALANLSSMMHLWSLATTQQGLGRGTLSTNKEVMRAIQSTLNVGKRVARGVKEGAQVYDADTQWALEQAKSEGLTDESFAAQLAQFSGSSTLARLNFERGDSMAKQLLWLGMQPQHMVETFVRRVTLVHQFEHYRKSMPREQAYAKARMDTYLTQGNNSILNRPAFMRGNAAPFLIYYGYMQLMGHLFSGAQERGRNLREAIDSGRTEGMTMEEARKNFYKISKNPIKGFTLKMYMGWFALAGAMGMPGAEDLDDIMQLVAEKMFGKHFSLKEQSYKVANYIANNAAELGIDINPRTLVHGTASNFDLFGMAPEMDASSSTSLGKMIPGLGGLDKVDENKYQFVTESMGPLGNTLSQILDAFSDDPSMLKRMSGLMPNIMSKWAKTYLEAERGVRAPSGAKVTVDLQTGELRDLSTGESLVRLMGFEPTVVTANKEIHWMQRERQMYWQTRRNQLVAAIYEAKLIGDREAESDARHELKEFNDDAPKELRIGSRDLRKALRRKEDLKRKDEKGKSRIKRYQASDDEIQDLVTGR